MRLVAERWGRPDKNVDVRMVQNDRVVGQDFSNEKQQRYVVVRTTGNKTVSIPIIGERAKDVRRYMKDGTKDVPRVIRDFIERFDLVYQKNCYDPDADNCN